MWMKKKISVVYLGVNKRNNILDKKDNTILYVEIDEDIKILNDY